MAWKDFQNWALLPVIIAMVGGTITYFKDLNRRKVGFSIVDFLLHVSTSAFVGGFINYFMIEMQYSSSFAGAAAGISGMYSHFLIKSAMNYIDKRIEK